MDGWSDNQKALDLLRIDDNRAFRMYDKSEFSLGQSDSIAVPSLVFRLETAFVDLSIQWKVSYSVRPFIYFMESKVFTTGTTALKA